MYYVINLQYYKWCLEHKKERTRSMIVLKAWVGYTCLKFAISTSLSKRNPYRLPSWSSPGRPPCWCAWQPASWRCPWGPRRRSRPRTGGRGRPAGRGRTASGARNGPWKWKSQNLFLVPFRGCHRQHNGWPNGCSLFSLNQSQSFGSLAHCAYYETVNVKLYRFHLTRSSGAWHSRINRYYFNTITQE